MKLSSQTMMLIGAGVLVVVVIVAVVLMKKKEKFASGQLIVTGTTASIPQLSNQVQMMNFINHVHKYAPGLSISFPPNVDSSITPPYNGKLQVVIPGQPVNSVLFGETLVNFWNDATNKFNRKVATANLVSPQSLNFPSAL
jgi:hypothetical protein